MAEGAGLGADLPLPRTVAEALGQGAVHAGDGQRVGELRSPRLLAGIEQQLDDGVRRHQVLTREAGTVEEDIFVGADIGLRQHPAQHFRTCLNRSRRTSFAAEQTQQKLGVQILAVFVDDRQILRQRLRLVRSQHQRRDRARPVAGDVAAAALRRGRHGECRKVRQFQVLGARATVNRNAALFQHAAEETRRKIGGVVDRQRLVESRIVGRYRAPQRELLGARLAQDADDARTGAGGRGHDAVVELVVVGEGLDADERLLARTSARLHAHELDVVVDGERGNRRAPLAAHVVLRPAVGIALEGEEGVVADDVAVNVAHTLLDELIGELLQHDHRRQAPLRAGDVR